MLGVTLYKLKLVDLKNGMELARIVKDRNGRSLILPNAVLSNKHIRVFKAWGISDVYIKGEGEDPVDEVEEKTMGFEEKSQVEKKLIEIFIHTDPRHPAIKELFQVCVKNKLTSKIS